MKRLNDLLLQVCGLLVMIMVPIMTLIIFVQVVMRYVFMSPFMWAEELARYLLIWISCLGSAYAVRKGMHISIAYIKDRVPNPVRFIMMITSHLITTVFFVFCLYHGWIDSIEEWSQRSAAMQIPMTFPKMAVPVGFGLMVIFNFELLIDEIKTAFSGKEKQSEVSV